MASDPDRETAMDKGRATVVEAIWPDLYPYQREMIMMIMNKKDKGELLVMPARRHGRATVAHTVNLIRSTTDMIKASRPHIVLVDDLGGE